MKPLTFVLENVLFAGLLEAEERAVVPARYEQEERFKAIARIGEAYLVVIYTERDTTIRIISFRPAKRKERRRYEDARQDC